MLNPSSLQSQLKDIYSTILPPAVEQVVLTLFPQETDIGEKIAKQCAETFDDMVSAQLAEMMANAIDYYVKNISISGMIITTGSPYTQQAQIVPAANNTVGGTIPNTFGIS